MDIQPRDRDPFDLARRAANVSELISASPAEHTRSLLTLWNQVLEEIQKICHSNIFWEEYRAWIK